MKILVFNCGSSSLKFRLIQMPGEKELAAGEAQRIGPKTAEPSRIVFKSADGPEQTILLRMNDHAEAFDQVLRLPLTGTELKPDLIAHRLVHGGSRFSDCAKVDEQAMADLEAVKMLAPIHNPPAIALVRVCRERFPLLPQYLVFDTAFHNTIPPAASAYALPQALCAQWGLRKYGFHGTSHHFVAGEAAALLGKPLSELNAVSCHLGSGGASLCAIVGGRSVENTMGYSPLQGLIMSTRCGDLDPAVTLQLLARHEGNARPVERLLNTQSGVLGLSGVSADIRDSLRALTAGPNQARAELTVQTYLWRLRKYLGAYLTLVGRADAVIFTDTIGETVPAVRRAVCADMEIFGLRLDDERNERAKELPADVAAPESPVRIFVIRTNEEVAIARRTYAVRGTAA